MKKILAILLLFSLTLLCLSGCGNEQEGPVKSISLPGNGIVPSSELEKAKKNESVLYIKGSDNEYEFQWAVFGTRIEKAADADMSVSVSKAEEGEYLVKLGGSPDFRPSLSIRLPEKINADTANVCDEEGNPLTDASVSAFPGYTDVSFYIQSNVQSYRVVFDLGEEQKSGGGTGNADYLSPVSASENNTATGDGRFSSGGVNQDRYLTDPVPEGKPLPVEPGDQKVETSTTYTCTFSINCASILNNMDLCDPEKMELVPADGWILRPTTVTFNPGESVFDVLQRTCRENGIHLEFEWTPLYNSSYIEGINNLYEFDVGNLSGWMFRVNGWFPNYGCSRYALQNGDNVEWLYTCDLGFDVGGGYAVGG